MDNNIEAGKRIISFLDRMSFEHKNDYFKKEDPEDSDFNVYYIKNTLPNQSPDKSTVLIIPNTKKVYNDRECKKIIDHYRKYEHNSYLVDYKGLLANEDKSNIISATQLFNYLFNIDEYYNKFFGVDPDVERIRNGYYIKRSYNLISNLDFQNVNHSFVNTIKQKWITKSGASPIFLIGDRGIGKTYSLKKLFVEVNEEHLKNPWISPSI
ncbi:MAG: hypothetical protein K9N00_06385 [Candidatus Marinimicrobia bacterium]|nr:hypothetical protein [Candidatus Neomarinimicrobiota bacterium]